MARYDAPSRGSGKQNTFFGGAAILAVGILVVKLIGMFYKIPLNNIIGAQATPTSTTPTTSTPSCSPSPPPACPWLSPSW